MGADLQAQLKDHFGFASFRHGQAEAVHSLLSGRNTLVVMPTGAGKSLVYQLAALLRPGVTLVISPLISLMKDQVQSLNRRSIPSTFINSTVPADMQAQRLSRMAAGRYRLVYVAPERLRSASFLQALAQVNLGLLAVDEAHCISAWGHDFRPDYLHIASARARMGNPLTAALTATATPQVQQEILRLLDLQPADRIVTGFNRPNLELLVRYTPDEAAKLDVLKDLLSGWTGGGTIVYTGTRRDAESVAEFVNMMGVKAEAYHAGLDAQVRSRVQHAFVSGDLPVVAATNAFGMGIDRPDVRLVAHYSVPGTLEAYYQEAGRAGRDGEPARAVLLYSPDDRSLQEWFIENEGFCEEDLSLVHTQITSRFSARGWCTMDELSLATGFTDVKLKLALAVLERVGALHRMGDEGQRLLLRSAKWNASAVRAAAAEGETRRVRRLKQLDEMIAYAESNDCRRRMLLRHFGDHGDPDAPACCDNCLGRQTAGGAAPGPRDFAQLAPETRVALIILDTLRRLKWSVGVGKLTGLLRGSRAQDMSRFGYDKSPYYGRLARYTESEVREMVDQLVKLGLVKVMGGRFPVLGLTAKGEGAVKSCQDVALRIPREPVRKPVPRHQEDYEGLDTVEITARLFQQGMSAERVAAERSLSRGTVYSHLAQLIGQARVPLGQVVDARTAAEIREAIKQVGDPSHLAPVKGLLPDSISYGIIRCVAEDMKRQRRATKAQQAAGDVILSFVRLLPGVVSRELAAEVLIGAKTADAAGFSENSFFGRLRGLPPSDIAAHVDALIHEGAIRLAQDGTLFPANPQR